MSELLEALERAVFTSQAEEVLPRLHAVLSDEEGEDIPAGQGVAYYNRLAQVISQWLLNEDTRIDYSAYCLLCAHQHHMVCIFACSDFGNADHVISALANIRDPQNIGFSGENNLFKCLACYWVTSHYHFNLEALAKSHPFLVMPLLTGMLSCDFFISPPILKKINELLTSDWSSLETQVPALPQQLNLSAAWMGCSYATTANKHHIKKWLNRLCRNVVVERGWDQYEVSVDTPPRDPVGVAGNKPVLAIVLEHFHSKHAMYRCFSGAISTLRPHFYVVAVVADQAVDDVARQLFDQVIEFDVCGAQLDASEPLKALRSLEPVMLYYPSLGMANFSLQLASLRLAPVQCMGLGHPATSHMPAMDFVVVQEQDFVTERVFSEMVVLTGNETSPTMDWVRQAIPEPGRERGGPVLRIGVTSKHMKINAEFLALCRQLWDRLEASGQFETVEFHVFPGVTGRLLDWVERAIVRVLPTATVYPTVDYARYLAWLDRCDFRLGTFPFGGANTNMDCFGLGIPFVAMRGDEPHARADIAQMEQADLPDWLMANNREEYLAAAERLAVNAGERQAISRGMQALDQHHFFLTPERKGAGHFAGTLQWLALNGPRALQAGRRVWALQDQGEAVG
ncbi:MAG: hypothetical protein ACQES2_03665 [Pseudomonadota bacterium]